MKKPLYIIFCTFSLITISLVGSPLRAQNQELLDTFMLRYKSAVHDTLKIKTLYDISWLYMNSNIDTAHTISNEALQWSQRINYRWGLSKGFILKGIYLTIQGEYSLAMDAYDECLQIKSEDKDSLGMASVYNNIGNVYLYRADYDMALAFFHQSLDIEERHGSPDRLAESYSNIGSVYAGMSKHEQALQYYKQYLQINKGLGKDNAIAEAANNIGNTYINLNYFDSAIVYFREAELNAVKWGNKTALSASYSGQAVYFEKYGQYAKAFELLEKAVLLCKESGNKQQTAATHIDAGNMALRNNELEIALLHARKGNELAFLIGAKKEIASSYLLLSKIEKHRNNFNKAIEWLELHNMYSDSVLNESTEEKIAELQTRFETEKKNAENTLLRSENTIKDLTIESQKRQRNILISIVVAVLIFSYLLYLYKKLRQEKTLQQERLQMQEIRSKAVIEAEENERQRIAKDLHDGVGQMIAAIKMNFQNLTNEKKNIALEDSNSVQNINAMIDDCAREVRSISHNMMPNILIRSGLVKAVRDFIDKISSSGQLKVELQVVGMDHRLESTIEHILYRVLQEIVSNIVKHAAANHVSIQFIRHEKNLTLMVEDNGIGFSVNEINNFQGLGLKNIQSRIEYLNGEVHFDSFPGKGTTVTIDVPLVS